MSTATVTKLKRKAADFEQKKQLDKALALYIQLVDEAGRDLDDADLQIYNRVGDLLMRQSNVSEALAYYEKAVDMYAERGFLNNAIALCNKILRQSPARTNVYYKLGRISASKGFKSDARKNFLEYADRMQKGGNIDEAFRALKEFADLCPDQDDIRLFLADLLTKEQRTDEAVEQLERLYAKLEAEGRSAEARATMDRIKAIDPDVTPKPSGSFISQKTNDLVFLDLNEPADAPASVSPLSVTPVADPPVAVDVSGVGALEGLAITFFPEEGGAAEAGSAAVNVDGLELNAVQVEPVDPAEIAPLDVVGSEDIAAPDPLEGIEIEATASVEDLDIVTPVEGLASITTTITGTHPSLAPLLDAPPLSGEEFGHLELEIGESKESPAPAHDLALPTSLPRLEAGERDTSESPSMADDAPGHESDAPATVEPVERKPAPAASESELAAVQSAHDAEQEEEGVRSVPPQSALDTSTLGDTQRRGTAPSAGHDSPEVNPRRSSFEEDRVELPLLDLEAQANAGSDEGAFDADAVAGSSIDDLLSAPPTFGDVEEPDSFDPAPLDLAPQPSTEEWEQPEVLIDGEWRDEHVGDLVSGEMFVIGERRQATRGPNDGGTFDDLAAAMMYDEDDLAEDERKAGAGSEVAHRDGRTSTLSFGGTEAQLRLRLESDPGNPALRRQLGEALLDDGHREEGLNELEQSVLTYESQGAFASAREVVDVILRVTPLSVHHHQKRVEYAVRANDRVQLIGAYTELADALFRCGESEKSRVVYARVLDLDPENDRARFALGILSEDSVALRSSDEIPTIDTGIAAGLPTTAPGATPGEAAPGGQPAASQRPLPDEPLSAHAAAPEAPVHEPPAAPDPELDGEVDAAFEEAHAKGSLPTPAVVVPVAEPTTELVLTPTVESLLTPEVAGDAGGFIDLGEWLRASEPSRSTRMVSDDVAPTGDENADFAEMLRRFKQGVAANVDDEDYASHYDLGVAFKEMGLIDEAIAEFQKALRGDDHRVRAYEALGQCFVEQQQYQVATTLLRRALESTRADDQRLVGVLYLLGYASETMGRHGDAVGYYQRVFAVDIEFRDVSSRLAALDRKTQ
jgi:tetratricopeptide (TPR) repeat protein